MAVIQAHGGLGCQGSWVLGLLGYLGALGLQVLGF